MGTFRNQNDFYQIQGQSDSESDSMKSIKFRNFKYSSKVVHQIFSEPSSPVASSVLKEKVGTHSAKEIDAVRRAISATFLELDESWINSINHDKIQNSIMH